jgi:hypothetical protein
MGFLRSGQLSKFELLLTWWTAFADATNVTSNGVYARLGYERVDEMVECVLEPA